MQVTQILYGFGAVFALIVGVPSIKLIVSMTRSWTKIEAAAETAATAASEAKAVAVEHGERLARIETVLTGPDGKNGIRGEVQKLRESHHEIRNVLQVHELDIDRLKEAAKVAS
jgi:hypothetical protein